MNSELEVEVTDGTKISLSLDDEQVAEIRKIDTGYSILVESKISEEERINQQNRYPDKHSLEEIIEELEEELEENPTTEDIRKRLKERGREDLEERLDEFLDNLAKRGRLMEHNGWRTV